MMDDCYPEITQVGFMELSTVDTMKNQDPIVWDLGKSEYIDSLATDKTILTFDHGFSYYWKEDIENLIDEYAEAA